LTLEVHLYRFSTYNKTEVRFTHSCKHTTLKKTTVLSRIHKTQPQFSQFIYYYYFFLLEYVGWPTGHEYLTGWLSPAPLLPRSKPFSLVGECRTLNGLSGLFVGAFHP